MFSLHYDPGSCLRRPGLPSLSLLLLAVASLFAQSPLEQALHLAREHRYADADRLLQGVTEPVPLNQRIAFHRLKAAVASGQQQSAIAVREMRLALALVPRDTGLLLATAVAESQAGQVDDALTHARAAGQSAAAQALIGDLEDRRGHYVEAARAYRFAVALAPDREQYRVALAFELIRHQTLHPAIALLQQSAPLFPKSAKILTLLGIAQYADGYSPDAVKSLTAAIKTDGKFQPAYACLAQIVLQSSAAPAQPVTRSLCQWDRTVCSALRLRASHASGDSQVQNQAIADLKLAPPQNPIAHCELGRAYEWSGNLAAARGELETCVHLEPTPQNHYRLGIVYQKLGLADLAHREMELRNGALRKMSEQTALGLNALESFSGALQ